MTTIVVSDISKFIYIANVKFFGFRTIQFVRLHNKENPNLPIELMCQEQIFEHIFELTKEQQERIIEKNLNDVYKVSAATVLEGDTDQILMQCGIHFGQDNKVSIGQIHFHNHSGHTSKTFNAINDDQDNDTSEHKQSNYEQAFNKGAAESYESFVWSDKINVNDLHGMSENIFCWNENIF